MRINYFLLFFSFFLVGCTNVNEVQVLKDKIIFEDGYEIVLKNKLDQFNVENTVINIKGWKRIFVIESISLYESGESILTVYDYQGEKLFPRIIYEGMIEIFEDGGRFIIVNISSHREAGDSFIYDKNGVVIKKLDGGGLVSHSVSQDKLLVWLFFVDYVEGELQTKLEVIDLNGDVKFSKYFRNSEDYIFKYLGREYLIKIPEPVIG